MGLWHSEVKERQSTVPSTDQQAREPTVGFGDWQACDQAQLYLTQRLQTTDKTVGENVEQRSGGADVPLFLCGLGNPVLPEAQESMGLLTSAGTSG